jgi:signal transduction histidine kinase
MEIWLWAAVGGLVMVNVVLLIKIHMMQKSAAEIETAFAKKLITDTNTLIDISSRDRYMRQLANGINKELRKLRTKRHRFEQGDLELKNAITNISHDLRTPLTAVCGYLELLEQEEKSEAAARYIEVVKERTETLVRLTEELFRYSVIISPDNDTMKEEVEVGNVLEESIAVFYFVLKKRNIVPRIEMPETKVVRELNRFSLSRVFQNLLSNVSKYSDGDLHITLSDDGEIVFSNMASDLDEIQVGKLFDRFYTVESGSRLAGLGLAIARTLVEQMNGTISAEYRDNRLSIRIFFPDKP